METAVLARSQDRIVDEAVAALERSRGLSVGGQHVTERGCRAWGGRFQGRRIRLVRLVDTVHIAEGGGQDVPTAPAEPECLGGGERVLRSAVKLFVDLADDPAPHAAGRAH